MGDHRCPECASRIVMHRTGGVWFIKCDKCGFIIEGRQPSKLIRELYGYPWKGKTIPNENIRPEVVESVEGVEVRPPEDTQKRINKPY